MARNSRGYFGKLVANPRQCAEFLGVDGELFGFSERTDRDLWPDSRAISRDELLLFCKYSHHDIAQLLRRLAYGPCRVPPTRPRRPPARACSQRFALLPGLRMGMRVFGKMTPGAKTVNGPMWWPPASECCRHLGACACLARHLCGCLRAVHATRGK